MKTPARSCLTLLISLTVLLLQSLLPRAVALAKSPPHLVTVTGARPAEPVEISDEASLVSFNPWTRGFIDWERGSVTSPPAAETTYTASFYLKREGDDLSLIYVLRYLPDPSGGQGFIYIPGPGDPWYRLNIGTIITGSSDRWDPNGKWQYATAEWDRVVRGALEARGHPAADPAAVTVEGPAPEPAGGADAAPIFLPSR